MKRTSVVGLLWIIFLLAAASAAFGQDDFIVLVKGDTLRGKVQHLNLGIEQKVQYTGNDKKKSTYSVLQVKAFRMRGEDYHAVRFFDSYKYMKLLLKGYASLYSYQEENRTTWDGRYVYRMDGTGLDVPNIGFKKKMVEFTNDCPQLTEELDAGKLGRVDLLKIIQQYNDCIAHNTLVSKTAGEIEARKQNEKLEGWDALSKAVTVHETLTNKESIQEMIAEAKGKTEKGERIPNFILDALKKSFENHKDLQELLQAALEQIKN